MKKLLLTIAAATLAVSGFSGVRQTNYSELTKFYDFVSNGLFHGNVLTADLNNDGLQEIIAKGRDLNNSWATVAKAIYHDETGINFGSSVDLPDPDGCMWERIIYTIDYNNDGNIDLLYASSWNAKLMKGNGDGTFEQVQDFYLDGEMSIDGNDGEKWYTGTLCVADFNHDGYQDIVTFCGNPREDKGTPVIFFNDNGTGKFIKDENTGIKPHRGGTLCVGDYNADGNIDILVNGWSDDFGNDCVKVWKNDGTGKFTELIVGDKAGTENGQVIFVDFTGNGLLDVFITGTSCPNGWENAAYVYINNGNDTFTKLDAGLPGCQKSGADWCDLNGDGFIDVVYGGEGQNNTIYAFNNGDNTFEAVTDKLEPHRGGTVVLAQDVNNNNVPDILVMGYRDAGAPHFQFYNGAGSRVSNQAPQAPTELSLSADGTKTILSWNAGSDAKAAQGTGFTPAEALRYNYYVKTTDGQIITAVPADITTGKLRQGNVNAASAAKSVTLNISSDKIAEWGVQTIDGGKAASAFAKGGTATGINNIVVNKSSAPVEYFNLQGVKINKPTNGVVIRRQGSKVAKVVIK